MSSENTYVGIRLSAASKRPSPQVEKAVLAVLGNPKNNTNNHSGKKQSKANRREKLAIEAARVLLDVENGFYQTLAGKKIDISEQMKKSISGAVWYKADEASLTKDRLADILVHKEKQTRSTSMYSTNESSLEAAKRLSGNDDEQVLVLNFASAKHPGGGFLNGSMAQEEALCLCSGLYHCISPFTTHYAVNHKTKDGIYTHSMIYSPDVPVFRRDNLQYYDKPFSCAFITSPAVNTGVVQRKFGKEDFDSYRKYASADQAIAQEMRERIYRILHVAYLHRHTKLVLGAFGCGVFQNNPIDVANLFKEVIEASFEDKFEEVVFAVLGENGPGNGNLEAFRQVFPFKQVK